MFEHKYYLLQPQQYESDRFLIEKVCYLYSFFTFSYLCLFLFLSLALSLSRVHAWARRIITTVLILKSHVWWAFPWRYWSVLPRH